MTKKWKILFSASQVLCGWLEILHWDWRITLEDLSHRNNIFKMPWNYNREHQNLLSAKTVSEKSWLGSSRIETASFLYDQLMIKANSKICLKSRTMSSDLSLLSWFHSFDQSYLETWKRRCSRVNLVLLLCSQNYVSFFVTLSIREAFLRFKTTGIWFAKLNQLVLKKVPLYLFRMCWRFQKNFV